MSQKIESVHFYSYPQAKLSPRQMEVAHSSSTAFSEDILPEQKGGGEEGLWSWKNLKKATRVLVTTFDKFQNLCNLYIFCLWSVVQ